MEGKKERKRPFFTVGDVDQRARDSPKGMIMRLPELDHGTVTVLQPPSFKEPAEYAAMGRRLVNYGPLPSIETPLEGALIPAMAEYAKIGDVYEHNLELFLKCSEKKSIRIANFTVRIIRRILKVSLYGEPEKWLLLELVSRKRRQTYKILASRFLQLASKLAEDAPEFRIYPDSGKGVAHFKVYLSRQIEEFGELLDEQRIYTYHGWQCEQGHWRYYSGIDEGCESDVRLVDLSQISVEDQQRADAFIWHALDLGDPFVIVPLFVHIHSGVLYRLFAEAGRPIRFVFDLQGPTSIGKTTLMEMLGCHFDAKKRMATFQSTGKGVEKFAEEEHHDSLVILDDLSSAQDKAGKALLERILRGCCNGSGRIVSSKGGRSYEIADVAFSVMMTSEAKAEGLRQSSQYRILTVPMTAESLNREVVEEFKGVLLTPKPGQVSPVDVHMTRFVRWSEGHFAELVRGIATSRTESLTFQTPRHEMTYCVFVAEAQIVMRYFVSVGVLGIEEAQKIFSEQWVPILTELIRFNEALGQESDPVKTFLEILIPGVQQMLIPVASNREAFEREPATFYGFWQKKVDGIRLVLDPVRVFQWTQRQFVALHREFPSTMDEILRKLAAKGASEGYVRNDRKNPKPLKVFKIAGASIKLLVLKWNDVEALLSK